jgi:MFS family permease
MGVSAPQSNVWGGDMNNNFSEVERRVQRYWYTDGIGELIGGGMFILLGIYFAAQTYLGENSAVSGWLQAGLILFLLGGMAIGRWLIKQLKSRLTYPRTGYVEYRVDEHSRNKRRIFVALVAGLVAAFSIVFASRMVSFLNMTVALTGLLVGAILIFLQGRRSGLERFYLLGGISVVLGIALSLGGLPDGYALGLFYSLMGVAFAISGGIVLRRYLRENPIPPEDRHE